MLTLACRKVSAYSSHFTFRSRWEQLLRSRRDYSRNPGLQMGMQVWNGTLHVSLSLGARCCAWFRIIAKVLSHSFRNLKIFLGIQPYPSTVYEGSAGGSRKFND